VGYDDYLEQLVYLLFLKRVMSSAGRPTTENYPFQKNTIGKAWLPNEALNLKITIPTCYTKYHIPKV
jgi:hypothetical protein